MDILKAIKSKRLYFDGGFGSLCISKGIEFESPVTLSLTHPKIVEEIHKEYINAGANIIKTNTFGATRLKYPNEYENIIRQSIKIAKKCRGNRKDVYIAFDMGSLGQMLSPMGTLDFNDAVEIFKDSVKVALSEGVDLFLLETFTDSYETKACVLAVKELTSLPIFVTNAYDKNGKLLTGASIKTMISLLEGLGVDAIGMNCSFGPDIMLKHIDEFTKYSSLPLIVNPNAGLPDIVNGKTVYKINETAFANYMLKLAKKGVNLLGGCCGTTPKYISETIKLTKDIPIYNLKQKNITLISSGSKLVEIDKEPLLIGERINPTGKPLLKQALLNKDYNYILNEGVKQEEKGVQILDVNVGMAGICEEEVLKNAIINLQSIIDLPLQIDTSNYLALEKAMRVYNGKPLINSVNGKKESKERVFPLVKKYGGVVIALTLDENGIPNSVKGRVEIANRIIKKAQEYGISKKDIIVDPLCLTVTSNPKSALITLKTVKKLNSLGIKTSLGISNISFGLPCREKVNSVFYANALNCGLNLAIINPFSTSIMDTYYAFKTLNNFDKLCEGYIDYISTQNTNEKVSKISDITLDYAIIKGLKNEALSLTKNLLETKKPLEIINEIIIPALTKVGTLFEDKKVFLPQLLASSEATTYVFDYLKDKLPKNNENLNKTVILATVKGDIHDIGKNIVKVLLESYGFTVLDLGKDVESSVILDKVIKTNCKIVGLSALMTTTLIEMENTISLLKNNVKDIKIMVGGAVLTSEYAKEINADYYAKDGLSAVKCVKEYYK